MNPYESYMKKQAILGELAGMAHAALPVIQHAGTGLMHAVTPVLQNANEALGLGAAAGATGGWGAKGIHGAVQKKSLAQAKSMASRARKESDGVYSERMAREFLNGNKRSPAATPQAGAHLEDRTLAKQAFIGGLIAGAARMAAPMIERAGASVLGRTVIGGAQAAMRAGEGSAVGTGMKVLNTGMHVANAASMVPHSAPAAGSVFGTH